MTGFTKAIDNVICCLKTEEILSIDEIYKLNELQKEISNTFLEIIKSKNKVIDE